MSTFHESEAFRAAFLQRFAELHGMEKNAGWGSNAVTGAWNAIKSTLPKAAPKAMVVDPSGIPLRPATGALGSAANWMTQNPKTSIGVGSAAAGLGAGATVAGMHANQKFNELATAAPEQMRKTYESWAQSQGYNNGFGRFMAFLSYLFGGQKWMNGQFNNFMQHAGGQYSHLDPRLRSAFAKAVPAAAPATTTPKS